MDIICTWKYIIYIKRTYYSNANLFIALYLWLIKEAVPFWAKEPERNPQVANALVCICLATTMNNSWSTFPHTAWTLFSERGRTQESTDYDLSLFSPILFALHEAFGSLKLETLSFLPPDDFYGDAQNVLYMAATIYMMTRQCQKIKICKNDLLCSFIFYLIHEKFCSCDQAKAPYLHIILLKCEKIYLEFQILQNFYHGMLIVDEFFQTITCW